MNIFFKTLIITIFSSILLGGSCDTPEIKNGGCQECEINVEFDNSKCPNAIQKVYAITIDDGVTTQSWMDTHSNHPGGIKTFEIQCGNTVYVTFTRECEFENGEILQMSDAALIYPQGCTAVAIMWPERNY